MRPWSIEWSQTAFNDLARLERTVARRIVAKVEQAAANPMRLFERLVGSADFKLRVGDFRVIALLSPEDRTVFVERVGHRSNIYDRR